MTKSLFALSDDRGRSFDFSGLAPVHAYTPTEGQEARSNVEQATGGTWGWVELCTIPQAQAAREMHAALECVAALEMSPEEGAPILAKHGAPEEPDMDAHDENACAEQMAAYETALRAWVSAKVRGALTKAEEG